MKNFERHGERDRVNIGEDSIGETVKRKAIIVNIADNTPPIVLIFVIERDTDRAHRIARLNHREQRPINASQGGDIQQQERSARICALVAGGSNVAAFANQSRSFRPLAGASRRGERIVALDESRS
jgi:hypothetical protein